MLLRHGVRSCLEYAEEWGCGARARSCRITNSRRTCRFSTWGATAMRPYAPRPTRGNASSSVSHAPSSRCPPRRRPATLPRRSPHAVMEVRVNARKSSNGSWREIRRCLSESPGTGRHSARQCQTHRLVRESGPRNFRSHAGMKKTLSPSRRWAAAAYASTAAPRNHRPGSAVSAGRASHTNRRPRHRLCREGDLPGTGAGGYREARELRHTLNALGAGCGRHLCGTRHRCGARMAQNPTRGLLEGVWRLSRSENR